MVVHKRKKSSRQRGCRTYGYGSKKKHRHSGHRGGVGHAGSGKKADQKKPNILDDKYYFGKYGFYNKTTTKINTITVQHLDNSADELLRKGIIKKEGDTFIVDMKEMGIDKVLSKGITKKKFKIVNAFVTDGAKKKIIAAGGSIVEKESSPAKEKT